MKALPEVRNVQVGFKPGQLHNDEYTASFDHDGAHYHCFIKNGEVGPSFARRHPKACLYRRRDADPHKVAYLDAEAAVNVLLVQAMFKVIRDDGLYDTAVEACVRAEQEQAQEIAAAGAKERRRKRLEKAAPLLLAVGRSLLAYETEQPGYFLAFDAAKLREAIAVADGE